jgi:hypothetical protein
MTGYLPTNATIDSLLSNGGLVPGESASSGELPISVSLICLPTRKSTGPTVGNGRHSPIYTLNGDVLLNVFHLYRLADPDEYEEDDSGLNFEWDRQRWWYKLTHVCRLWRNLILGSPSRLDLNLLCTYGVPVADMLAHSPPLPLTMYYEGGDREITADDESGILLALSQRNRVRRISFSMPTQKMRKAIAAMDGQFPVLERMYIISRTASEVVLPVTFQAHNLCHLILMPVCIPIRSRLLTTTTGLVTLSLLDIPVSTYLPPNYLRTRLSLMPQLEMLVIEFRSPLSSRDVARQLFHTQNMSQITLTNLRHFDFQGTATYLEGLIARISAPSLKIIWIYLYNQLSFSLLCLLQFMLSSENLRLRAVKIAFNAFTVALKATVVPLNTTPPLELQIKCNHLDWQVASTVQMLDTLTPALSSVEKVTLSHEEHTQSSEWHNHVDRTQWREILRTFTNAKTIHIQNDLVGKILPSLLSDDGEPSLGFLPNLQEVEYSGGSDARDALTAFADERWVAGHPVNLRLVDL